MNHLVPTPLLYFRCLACNSKLSAATSHRHGLCSRCKDAIADYDQPYTDHQYAFSHLTEGFLEPRISSDLV